VLFGLVPNLLLEFSTVRTEVSRGSIGIVGICSACARVRMYQGYTLFSLFVFTKLCSSYITFQVSGDLGLVSGEKIFYELLFICIDRVCLFIGTDHFNLVRTGPL
jgi:hypothetical protein